jgi:hypothetical protein
VTTEFMAKYRQLGRNVMDAPVIHTGSWQSTDTTDNPLRATHEIQDVTFVLPIPESLQQLREDMPVVNRPWADKHFLERVGGVPLNPPPSHTEWPWARNNLQFQLGDQGPFSHSYPERMWPRHAGQCHQPYTYDADGGAIPVDMHGRDDDGRIRCDGRQGIRYRYGDLDDLVTLLCREPLTRQAYLPIWFPEDTGTHHGERVPCTLGYHFMIRDGQLSCRYFMRSCDFVRHFANDVYFAARLTQWVCHEVNTRDDGLLGIQTGHVRMYITSLHAFVGDVHFIKKAL